MESRGNKMDLILPMAGESGLLSQGFEENTSLTIAGKPLIEHIIRKVDHFDFEKAIFILDKDRPTFKTYIKETFDFEAKFIKQVSKKGPAHAIYGAEKYVDDDVFILFSDTFIEFDETLVSAFDGDGLVLTKEVENPTEYGVVFEHDKQITRMTEKPDIPSSDQAMVGAYYFRDSETLFDNIDHIIENDITSNEAFHLTDAIQLMIEEGSDIRKGEVDLWINMDRPDNLLEVNRLLLDEEDHDGYQTENSVIIPPVYFDHTVEIINSVVGPHVSLESDVTLENARVKNAILSKGCNVEGVVLDESIIGKYADIKSKSNKVTVGDYSEVQFS